MTAANVRVLMIGAGGAFGSRLAERLAATTGLHLVLAGRDLARAAAQAEWLRAKYPNASFSVARLDRTTVTSDELRSERAHVAVDAAGPFEPAGYRVVEAAIGAPCHYVDLADNRPFVAGIGAFDQQAREAGVAILAGASSTPALSHAALDAITRGWRRIDTVQVAICPGNRAPRGLAVVQSILSWTGQPIRVFCDGDWREEWGWSGTRSVDIPGLGRRLASLAETPDLDLLVARYRPRVSAEFLAGLELPLLHRGLLALGLLVRYGLVDSLRPFAPAARRIADLLRSFGTDRGGMLVEAQGLDPRGHPVRATWSLVAERGVGPGVPGLPAAAIVRQLQSGTLTFRGAGPCVGILSLADLAGDFDALGLQTEIRTELLTERPLFARALGPAFDGLPPITRRLHQPAPALVWRGRADVSGAQTAIGRGIARLFGFPPQGEDVPLRVVMQVQGGAERWTRYYGETAMVSVLENPDSSACTVEERFGAIAVRQRVASDAEGLSLVPLRARLGPIALPRAMLPRVVARESVDEEGRHRFDVEIGLPIVGRLVHYRGFLTGDEPD